MEIRVLDTSFNAVAILEGADSVIWNDRYSEAGEFEIYTRVNPVFQNLLLEDRYLTNSMSDKIMVIESISIITDPETGDKLVVKGRSLESILDRRIILKQKLIDTTFQAGIQSILNSEIISGEFSERNFPNFIFSTSTDPLVTTPTLKSQYYMDNVLEVISGLCKSYGLGFKIVRNTSNQYVFSLYAGVDRSYSQTANRWVIFSPNLDNLVRSQYFRSKQFKKNFVFVSGDAGLQDWNQGFYGRWAQVWTTDVGTGLSRREMFLDANNLQKEISGGSVEMSDDDFVAQLEQRGREELAVNAEYTIFDGEVDLGYTYGYRTDFNLGDIIQLIDNYGHSSAVRITEVTLSEGTNGFFVHPTLKTV